MQYHSMQPILETVSFLSIEGVTTMLQIGIEERQDLLALAYVGGNLHMIGKQLVQCNRIPCLISLKVQELSKRHSIERINALPSA